MRTASHRPSLRSGLRLIRALLGDRLSCPRPRDAEHHRVRDNPLSRIVRDISTGISGPRDFAVRDGVVRPTTPSRPPHPALNVRDDRETPLFERARDVGEDDVDLPDAASTRGCDMVARRAVTEEVTLPPVGAIRVVRTYVFSSSFRGASSQKTAKLSYA